MNTAPTPPASVYACEHCGKEYAGASGLWYHQKRTLCVVPQVVNRDCKLYEQYEWALDPAKTSVVLSDFNWTPPRYTATTWTMWFNHFEF